MKKENYNLQCVSALGFLLAGFLSFPSFADVEREKKIMIKKSAALLSRHRFLHLSRRIVNAISWVVGRGVRGGDGCI